MQRSRKSTGVTRKNSRRGIAVVWVAILGLVFIAFVGLASDTAHVYLASHQLQNAADAAALAGAGKVKLSAALAHEAAMLTAAANHANNQSVQLAPNLSARSPGCKTPMCRALRSRCAADCSRRESWR